VALAALDLLLAVEVDLLPVDGVTHNTGTDNLLDGFAVHAAYHVGGVAACCEGRGLTGWGYPALALLLGADFGSEAFSLLHALDEGLNTSG